MSLTPVLSTDEDIGGIPCMQSRYSAKIKRYEICMEEMGIRCIKVRRSKSEDALCRLLTTMMEETFDIKKSQVNLVSQIMNLRNESAGGESSNRHVQQRKKHDEENLGGAFQRARRNVRCNKIK